MESAGEEGRRSMVTDDACYPRPGGGARRTRRRLCHAPSRLGFRTCIKYYSFVLLNSLLLLLMMLLTMAVVGFRLGCGAASEADF